MIIDKTDAILSLKPGASFSVYANDRIDWNSPDITQPTEEEVNAKITELKNAEPMRLLRIERDRLIGQSDWRVTKAKETGTNIPTAWKNYRQALRDLPSSANPTLGDDGGLDASSVTWPTEPS